MPKHWCKPANRFMMLPYNNRNHNITGGNTRNHLYTSITNFFIENMK